MQWLMDHGFGVWVMDDGWMEKRKKKMFLCCQLSVQYKYKSTVLYRGTVLVPYPTHHPIFWLCVITNPYSTLEFKGLPVSLYSMFECVPGMYVKLKNFIWYILYNCKPKAIKEDDLSYTQTLHSPINTRRTVKQWKIVEKMVAGGRYQFVITTSSSAAFVKMMPSHGWLHTYSTSLDGLYYFWVTFVYIVPSFFNHVT